MPTNAATAIPQMKERLGLYNVAFKIGLYQAMDIVAAELESVLKTIHSEIAWWNEPADRSPGDLEHTYVGFVQAAIGEGEFVFNQANSQEGAMRNWDTKPMYPGMIIGTREGDQRELTDEDFAMFHSRPALNNSQALPGIVQAILTSPMTYAIWQEKGPYAYPVIDQVIREVAPYTMAILGMYIKRRLAMLAGDLNG